MSQSTRRTFIKSAACAVAAPTIVPRSVFGANAPSNRINVGFIGLGNQSKVDLPAFLENDDVQVLAVCDVNTGSIGYRVPEDFLGREPGKQSVEAYYADKSHSGSYKGCAAYTDFREVLGRDDIDAVVIITPDHWHATMTIAAARAGKDIYCEKPLSLTVEDGKAMVKAVREHKRILQTGSQHRSNDNMRRGCELVRNGRIGDLERITAYIAENNFTGPGTSWMPMPVPKGFDYAMWLGPAPKAPYHEDRCLYKFRFIEEYSGGQTTNFGAHSLDLAQLGHGSELTGPLEFTDAGSEWPESGSLFTTATRVAFHARYADGVELICETRPPGFGARFEGSEGWVQVDSSGVHASPKSLLTSVIGPDEFHLPVAVPGKPVTRYDRVSPQHVRNFLDAVKSRQDPIEPVEVGHRTATICHLGNIAMKLKRKIKWDPESEQIIGDDEAAGMLKRPKREPWEI
ncbi:Gfo/Idh/MocA family protein [Adhaeretor mobilis]|uniref:1,5-anhydro-D-fructose reductase n=1 Tax=Adhaeretor mobilis TaxID=1930276 RepID=A0A517MZT0_9BACT|nr:Gfo/Idh/MocA family oxidoreductase [Adhaeretor mobilis]QDT00389.1 1,5-anhydro-D-fructose reductase [Adhaeretor mobilis]